MPEVNEDLNVLGGTFTDSGEGDVDFYTFWYSLCYFLGILDVFEEELTDIPGNRIMLERFLESKGIIINSFMGYEHLLYVYDNWLQQIKNRGTSLVRLQKGYSSEVGQRDYVEDVSPDVNIANNSGIGVKLGIGDLILSQPINMGKYFSAEFTTIFSGDGVVINNTLFEDTLNFIRIVTTNIPVGGKVTVDFYIEIAGITHLLGSSDVSVNALTEVKVVRKYADVYLYINDDLISHIITASNDFNLVNLSTGSGLLLGSMKVEIFNSLFVKTSSYEWYFNVGAGYRIPCNVHGYEAEFAGITIDDTWADLWVVNSLFQNNTYVGVDQEALRLFAYDFGEFTYELVKDSELGFTIDISSPMSEEANCYNMNKVLGKGDLTNIHMLPLYFTDQIRPVSESGYIKYSVPTGNVAYLGMNSSLYLQPDWRLNLDYKPNGMLPFTPIGVANYLDNFDGYEVSFVIRSTKNIDLKFGIHGYDQQFNYLNDVIAKYTDDTLTDYFLDQSNWGLCVNRDVLVRGVFSPYILLGVSTKINLGVGDNLYNVDLRPDFNFIVPFIGARITGALSGDIFIKDIVVRPLSLPTSKGIIYPKNEIMVMSNNNSGLLEQDILNGLDRIAPYNSTINLKVL